MNDVIDPSEDGTIPPGRRTGRGTKSILPFLNRALKTKPQIPVQPQDAEPGIDFSDSTQYGE